MGLLRALGILIGVILLLPGACSLGFMVFFIGGALQGPGGGMSDLGPLALLWIFCFAVSLGGVAMISQRDPRPEAVAARSADLIFVGFPRRPRVLTPRAMTTRIDARFAALPTPAAPRW